MTAPDAVPDPAVSTGRDSWHPVWTPDVHRFRRDEEYADAVQAFVAHHVPNGSPSDAAVLEDNAGTRWFATTSWYLDGELKRDHRGVPLRSPVVVPLDLEVPIP